MDNMYETKSLNNLRNDDTFIEKTKKEDEKKLFSKIELTGNGNEKSAGMIDRIDEHHNSIKSETKQEYARLWKTENVSDKLMQNANRYDLSKSNYLREEIESDLERLAAIDSHRSEKSRKKYIKKASEKYKRAAEKMKGYADGKEAGRAWKMVENGEAAILAVYEAEQSLIKAGGIYDINEKIRIARNYVKCQDMLRRFYKDCLKRKDLTVKERKKLQNKLTKAKKDGISAECTMVAGTLKTVPPTKELAQEGVMTKAQFLRYINKSNIKKLPEDINALADALQIYHEYYKGLNTNENVGDVGKNITELCDKIKKDNPGKLKLHVTINILKEQVRQHINGQEINTDKSKKKQILISGVENLSKNDKVNAELLKDDTYFDYGYMHDEDFDKMSASNIGNSEEIKKIINPGNNGLTGYLKTRNASMINAYLRTGEISDQVIEQTNKKENNFTAAQWKKEAEKTIDRMWLATHNNVLKKKTRLTRMVNIDFFDYALKMDKKYLPKNKDAVISAEQSESIAKQAQKYVGTVITDKSFISTGAKVDMPFRYLPVMMTLLCEKGQKCFVTDNKIETEVILPKNSKYVIVGVVSHAGKGIKVPVVSGENHEQEIETYKGIEVIVKVIENADELYKEEPKIKKLELKKINKKPEIKKPEIKKTEIKKPEVMKTETKKKETKKKEDKKTVLNSINLLNEDMIFTSDYMTDKEFEEMFLMQEKFISKYEKKNTKTQNKTQNKKSDKKQNNKIKQNTTKTKSSSGIDWDLEFQMSAMYDDYLDYGYQSNIYSTVSNSNKSQYSRHLSYGGKGLSGTGAMNRELKRYEQNAKANDYISDVVNTEEQEYAYQDVYDGMAMFDFIKADSTVQTETIDKEGKKRTYTTIKNTPKMKLYLSNDPEYINMHWNDVKEIDNEINGFEMYMRRRVELIKKIDRYKKKHPETKPGQVLDANKKAISDKDISAMGDKIYDMDAYYELTGVSFAGHQTTGLGCWSVSMASQLTYRGVDMTQQEVRMFRPDNLDANDLKEQVEFLGKDAMGSPVEVSELMNHCFDNMATHVVEAESIYQNNSGMSGAAIAEANVEYFRRSIIDGIVKHKSPVSLLYGNHFVTIIGIQGTKIKYLDSGSMRKDGVRFGDLKDMCGSGPGQKMQLVWFEQLDEGGKNVVQNVTERTDAVYDGDKLRIEKNKLEGDDRYIDKGMERCYNKKAVAFNDKKSRMEKQRALMNMNSKYRAGNKVLNRNDNYIINDKIYIPRRIKQN